MLRKENIICTYGWMWGLDGKIKFERVGKGRIKVRIPGEIARIKGY